MRIYCKAEQHEIGGPGTFFLARSQKLLPRLIEEYAGKVQLIYLDPPFGTGDTFQQKDEKEAPGGVPLFRDNMPEAEYLKWMRTILTGCRDLLSPSGSLYLHIDWRMSAKLRLMLDEIFGQDNFMDEIIWGYKTGGRATRFFPRKHDTILFYRKSRRVYFNIAAVGTPRGPEPRNHMKQFVDQDGRVGFSIRTRGKLYTYYDDEPVAPTDVWQDLGHLHIVRPGDLSDVPYGVHHSSLPFSPILSVNLTKQNRKRIVVMQKRPYLLLFSYSKLEYYKFKLEFRVAVLEAFVVMGAFAADKFWAGAGGN